LETFNDDTLEHLLDIGSWLNEPAADAMLSVSAAHFARCTCFNIVGVSSRWLAVAVRTGAGRLDRQTDSRPETGKTKPPR